MKPGGSLPLDVLRRDAIVKRGAVAIQPQSHAIRMIRERCSHAGASPADVASE